MLTNLGALRSLAFFWPFFFLFFLGSLLSVLVLSLEVDLSQDFMPLFFFAGGGWGDLEGLGHAAQSKRQRHLKLCKELYKRSRPILKIEKRPICQKKGNKKLHLVLKYRTDILRLT